MANPTTRTELKNYCLRRLGYPVLDINVDEDQLQDRIDDALEYYRDYHYDGTEKVYLKHVITTTNITNEYIAIPATVTGIIGVFDIGDAVNTGNMFNARYQMHFTDLFDFQSTTLAPYSAAMTHIAAAEEMLVGKQPVRFNRHTDKLYIDMDWASVTAGNYIIVECYKYLDPSTYASVWGDQWLRKYTTALIKRQWGENLKKFEGMQLPGGVTFNGQTIWQEAVDEIKEMEEQVMSGFGVPPMDMVG